MWWTEFSRRQLLLTIGSGILLLVCAWGINELGGPRWPNQHPDDPPAALFVGLLGLIVLVVLPISMVLTNIFFYFVRRKRKQRTPL